MAAPAPSTVLSRSLSFASEFYSLSFISRPRSVSTDRVSLLFISAICPAASWNSTSHVQLISRRRPSRMPASSIRWLSDTFGRASFVFYCIDPPPVASPLSSELLSAPEGQPRTLVTRPIPVRLNRGSAWRCGSSATLSFFISAICNLCRHSPEVTAALFVRTRAARRRYMCAVDRLR